MASELSPAHLRSGLVMTVDGPIPSADLGVTLMHEHLQNDCRCWWNPPREPERQHLAEGPVRIEILGELRQDPFVNRHNIALDELDLAIKEVAAFAQAGGRTVVDPTCRGIGRDPVKLRAIASGTGLQVVMGAGYYLHTSFPAGFEALSADDIADQIVREALDGVDGTDARIGLIGEIGVSSDFTKGEERSLRGAARAMVRTDVSGTPASCPQAASMSCPFSRRNVAVTPRRVSASRNFSWACSSGRSHGRPSTAL